MSIVLTKQQQQVFDTKVPYRILSWGRGSGRTTLAIEICHEQMEKGENVLFLSPNIGISRETFSKVRGIHKSLRRMQVIHESGLATTTFGSFNDLDELLWSLMGKHIKMIILDNVDMTTHTFQFELKRLLRHCPFAELFMTGLPVSEETVFAGPGKMIITEDHWFKKWFYAFKKGDPKYYAAFQGSSFDNPHLNTRYFEDTKNQLSEAQFKALYQGEFSNDDL